MAFAGDTGWFQVHRWVVVVVLVALVVVGLFSFGYAVNNAQAQQKATELVAALEAEGLRAPANTDTIVRVFGDDGGAICDDPGSSLRKALLDQSLTNGAGFVGTRPIIAERNLIKGEIVVLQVYCPDVLDDFQDRVADYKLDDVSGT